ncbi:hypothetical protein PCASD_11512 [Puccinia coronata f. sp. avenae]|uniref:Uncharacterized protein n=1 Tax=Puccinia coronata f. sp. avenae TaxID=200324 RepID=A0A2N5UM39_9BASI|nr:hypothetical protein PCASD_11512 [Puccinia coronata f. sp. avenae]
MTTHTGTTRTKSPRVAWNRHAASLVPYCSQDAAVSVLASVSVQGRTEGRKHAPRMLRDLRGTKPSRFRFVSSESVRVKKMKKFVLEQPCSTGDWTGTVRHKPVPAGRTGLPDQFPAGGDRSQPRTERTGPSDRLARALVGPCLSDHRSNTAAVSGVLLRASHSYQGQAARTNGIRPSLLHRPLPLHSPLSQLFISKLKVIVYIILQGGPALPATVTTPGEISERGESSGSLDKRYIFEGSVSPGSYVVSDHFKRDDSGLPPYNINPGIITPPPKQRCCHNCRVKW